MVYLLNVMQHCAHSPSTLFCLSYALMFLMDKTGIAVWLDSDQAGPDHLSHRFWAATSRIYLFLSTCTQTRKKRKKTT